MTMIPSQLLPSALTRSETVARRIVLGEAGSDPVRPCLVFLCFDDSGSLTSGHDPVGARYNEAEHTLTHISASSDTDSQQVAVFRFDHPQIAPVGPRPLHTTHHLRKLKRAIQPPKNAVGASTLTPAMMAINRVAERHPDADRVAVIFSDFELVDLNPRQPYDEIAAFPGIVHAVVMNAAPPPELTALGNVLVTRVSSTDPPGRLAAALAHTLTLFRAGATPARLESHHPS